MPTAIKQWASPNLERREVEKRIYGVKGCGSQLPLPFMTVDYLQNVTEK